MKLLFFDDFRLGVLNGNNVIDVSQVVRHLPHSAPQDVIRGVIERFDEFRGALQDAGSRGQGTPLSQVRVRSPLPKPTNIICMAVNYLESGTRPDPAPIDAFPKSPLAVIGDGDTMILPDVPASIFEGEAELAVVIGEKTAHVSEADAFDHVFGYTNFIDGSARGLGGLSYFYRMKSRETFAPMGPFLVTADEIADPQNLHVRLWNNGELRQDFPTSDMAHPIARCIAWVSSIHPLEAGDVLATGTNHRGLHAFQDGDQIEVEITGLGRLHINVRDDLKRRWPKETRGDRLARGIGANWIGEPPAQQSGNYAPEPQPVTAS
jgi:2-keto-4-pentenoate hydratase/2-oxohepta-3-ene-1,7-dioic acid hydratase in catechol pathway